MGAYNPFDWDDPPEFSKKVDREDGLDQAVVDAFTDRRVCYTCGDPVLPLQGVCDRHDPLLQNTLEAGFKKLEIYLTGR